MPSRSTTSTRLLALTRVGLPWQASLLALLVAAWVLPAGLGLDLCACGEGGHALLCEAERTPTAEASGRSCCATPGEDRARAESVQGSCPGCPVVELPELQLDLPVAPSSFEYPLALSARGSDRVDLGHGFRPTWTALGSRAPPGKVPRYLLLGRIRC